MKSALKIAFAVTCGLSAGGGGVQLLHAQSKPPAFVVTEIAVKDEDGYTQNFLKAAQKDIADHGGKYVAGGYRKTLSLAGSEPPNRVVNSSVRQYGRGQGVARSRRHGSRELRRQQIRLVPHLCCRGRDAVN